MLSRIHVHELTPDEPRISAEDLAARLRERGVWEWVEVENGSVMLAGPAPDRTTLQEIERYGYEQLVFTIQARVLANPKIAADWTADNVEVLAGAGVLAMLLWGAVLRWRYQLTLGPARDVRSSLVVAVSLGVAALGLEWPISSFQRLILPPLRNKPGS